MTRDQRRGEIRREGGRFLAILTVTYICSFGMLFMGRAWFVASALACVCVPLVYWLTRRGA